MAEKITVACPECSARMSVPDSKLGKKIKCPKCDEMFVAEATDDMDELEDLEDELPEDLDEPKRRKSGGGGGKKSAKKSKKSESSGVMGLVMFGVIGFLVLVSVALYAFVFTKRPEQPQRPIVADSAPTEPAPAAAAETKAEPEKPAVPVASEMTTTEKVLGLRWISPESDLLIHVKVGDIVRSPLLKTLLSNPSVTPMLAMYEKQAGMSLEDIESITFGVNQLKQVFENGIPTEPNTGLMVAKTKKAIDSKLLASSMPEAKQKDLQGKTYYEVPASPVSPGGAWWSPDPNTMISGTTKEVFVAMERGETVVPRKEFAGLDPSPHILVAAVIPDLPPDSKATGPESQPFVTSLRDELKAIGPKMATLAVTVKGGFDLQIALQSATSEGTANAKKEVESRIGQLKTMFEEYKKTAPPLFAELGEMLLTNLKTDEKDQIVRISTNIPDSEQAKLEQVPTIVMMMAMTGGFGTPAGSPTTNNTPETNSASIPANLETKLPGETDSVESASTEGLEDGMTITAKSAWSTASAASQNGTSGKTIDLVIDLKGPGIETICGSAAIIPKTMALENGGVLNKSKAKQSPGALSDPPFREFDPTESAAEHSHPPQTLRVKLTVDAPKSDVRKVEVFEGLFRYMTAREAEEIKIPDPIQASKTVSTDPAFKIGNIQLQYHPPDRSNKHHWLALSCGKNYFIGHVDGEPGGVTNKPFVKNDRTFQHVSPKNENGSFPDDFVLSFVLHSQLDEHVVKFKFEDVPLPESDSSASTSSTKETPEMSSSPPASKIERKKITAPTVQPDAK